MRLRRKIAVLLAFSFFLTSGYPRSLQAQSQTEIYMHRENSLQFTLNPEILKAGGVQYFFEMTDKISDESQLTSQQAKAFTALLPIDTEKVWQAKSHPQYSLILNRIAYQVQKPLSFFSRENITSKRYLDAVTADVNFTQIKDFTHPRENVVRAHVHRIWNPSFTARLSYLSAVAQNVTEEEKKAISNIRILNPELPGPDVVVIQVGYDFDRVLLQQTCERAYTISSHYKIDEQNTLVITYTLSFLINIPPPKYRHIPFDSFIEGTQYYLKALKGFQ